MSKLKCTCGHIFVDQLDNISYKGYVIPDTQVDKISTTFSDSIDKLIDATNSKKRLEWIKENFSVPLHILQT